MDKNDEVKSLARDLKVLQRELRKARQDKRDLPDVGCDASHQFCLISSKICSKILS